MITKQLLAEFDAGKISEKELSEKLAAHICFTRMVLRSCKK